MADLLKHPWLAIESVSKLTELIPDEQVLDESMRESFKEQDLLGLHESIVT